MTARDQAVKSSPLGYPQFSTLMGVHPDFSVFRRFSVTRARLLLQKQQRVSELEMQLEELDSQEPRPLYLGSFQADANASRLQVLKDLDKALADYDDLMKRSTKILQLPQASRQSVTSLLNWVNSTGSIVRKETAFLHDRDLCAVGAREDHGIAWIEFLIERILFYFYRSFIFSPSYSKQIFLIESHALHVTAQLCVTTLIVLLMLIPMVVMHTLASATMQMACILLMSLLFTGIISSPVNARTTEIFGPSATYVTLLTVFLTARRQQ